MGQAVQRGGGLGALELVAQVLDLGLCRPQAVEEFFRLRMHLSGAQLQFIEHARQVVDYGFLQGGQAVCQAGLKVLAADDIALYIAFDVVDQFNDRVDLLWLLPVLPG